MNKLGVVVFPLPVTSIIIVYNLGFISSVNAQDDIYLSVFDSSNSFYLAENRVDLESLAWTSLSWDFPAISNASWDSKFFLNFPENEKSDLSTTLIPEKILESTISPLLTTRIDFSTGLQSLASANNLEEGLLNNPGDRLTVDLESLKVKADKSVIMHSLAEESINLQPKEQRKNFPSHKNNSRLRFPDNTPITFVENPRHQNNRPPVLVASSINSSTSVATIRRWNGSVQLEPTFIHNPLHQNLASLNQNDQHYKIASSLVKVSDLKDVEPSDWTYQALIKLIESYGCFSGFDDDTFKGDRILTRYEFAATLNSCLKTIETLVSEDAPNTPESIELGRLKAEFSTELLTIQAEIDDLEQRTAFLEEHNFSTTTILRGQVDFVIASAFGDLKAVPSGETPTEKLDNEVTFSSRARLNFETSFTGKDLFRTRLEGGNLNAFGSGVTGTQMTFLGAGTNTDNNIRVGQVFYRFPLGDKGNAYIAAARQSASAFIPTLNRASTISLFGFNNPLYDLGFGAGGGVYYQFSDTIGAGVTYYSGSPDSPESNRGFFNGDYSALGQVTFTPSDRLGVSLTYAHFFSPEPGATNNITSFTGSQFAQLPFGEDTATGSDNFNLAFSYQISDRLELGGWLGYINANAKSSPADSGFIDLPNANADIWTGAVSASYNDLGKLGSKLSVILGIPPKLTDNDLPDRQDNDTSLHVEFSYSYPLTERITLKPGVLAITNPEHNSENPGIIIGLFQTTFSF